LHFPEKLTKVTYISKNYYRTSFQEWR